MGETTRQAFLQKFDREISEAAKARP